MTSRLTLAGCGGIAGHGRAPCVNEKSGVDDRDSAGVRNSSVRGKVTTRHLAGGLFDRDLALGYIRVRVVDLMLYRPLGRTGRQVSEIGFGAWAIGADWGQVDDEQSLRALHAAADAGVTFFDTADVYGDGRSERLIAGFRKERTEPIVVATKIGRRAPLDLKAYTRENFGAWIDRSRENLNMDRHDLNQPQSPPSDSNYQPQISKPTAELLTAGQIPH